MDLFLLACAAISAALLSRSWRCQPRGKRVRAAGSGSYMPRCCERGIPNNSALWAIGCITRCSEREVAVLCHLIRTFLKMSRPSTLHPFDTELFITETEQLPAISHSRSSFHSKKKENPTCERHCVRNLSTFFYFRKFSCAAMQA